MSASPFHRGRRTRAPGVPGVDGQEMLDAFVSSLHKDRREAEDTALRQPEQGEKSRRRDGAKTWVCKPCPQAPHEEACQDWDFFFKRDSRPRAVHQMLQSPALPLPCRILTAVQRAPVRQSFSTPALAPGLSRLNRKGHGRACLFSILHPPSSMDAANSPSRQRHGPDNFDMPLTIPTTADRSLLSPRPHRLERPPPSGLGLAQEQRPCLVPEIPASAAVRTRHICNPTDEVKGHPRTLQSSIQNPGDGRSKSRRCLGCIVPAPRWPMLQITLQQAWC